MNTIKTYQYFPDCVQIAIWKESSGGEWQEELFMRKRADGMTEDLKDGYACSITQMCEEIVRVTSSNPQNKVVYSSTILEIRFTVGVAVAKQQAKTKVKQFMKRTRRN